METALTPALGAAAQNITAEEFDAIVRRHQRRVHRWLLLLVRDPDEADNLTQECFLRAYQNLSSFRGESSLETWLLRIAANLARDHHRSRRTSFWKRLLGFNDGGNEDWAESIPAPEATPEQTLLAREDVRAVWDAANQLAQQQRAVSPAPFCGGHGVERDRGGSGAAGGQRQDAPFPSVADCAR